MGLAISCRDLEDYSFLCQHHCSLVLLFVRLIGGVEKVRLIGGVEKVRLIGGVEKVRRNDGLETGDIIAEALVLALLRKDEERVYELCLADLLSLGFLCSSLAGLPLFLSCLASSVPLSSR
jgi:hypothetical protein